MKKAALICVTRNNAEKLQTTLNSIILKTNPEHYDLFIIDNASSDSTLGIYQLPTLADNITIVRSGKNLNWVGGINLGLEMTRGYQYVGFLNDEIEVCPNWLVSSLLSSRIYFQVIFWRRGFLSIQKEQPFHCRL